MKHLFVALVALLLAISGPAIAETETSETAKSESSGVVTLEYDPDKIFNVQASERFITTIVIGDGEEIIDMEIGDKDSWRLRNPANRIVTIQAKSPEAPGTNLVVISNEKLYIFAINFVEQDESESAPGNLLVRFKSGE